MDILETELQFIEDRHADHSRVVSSFGRGWLLFGVIASLMTLTLQGGSGLAGSALLHRVGLSLSYGVLIFGLMQTLTNRLEVADAQESLHKRMVTESVMNLQSGDNPRIVEHKLSVFIEPRSRPSGKPAPPQSAPQSTQADEELVAEVARNPASTTDTTFQFADAARLSDRSIQAALRQIDQKDLVGGLKGAPESVRVKFFGNMSQRVRGFIKEEIGHLQADAATIAEVQGRISNHIAKLAEEGKIDLPEAEA